MTLTGDHMNYADAAYHTVHDYPGGAPSLAPRMGVGATVLSNKVNPNNEHNKLTLDEAVRLQEITGDARILSAMAQQLGFAVFRMPVFEGVSDQAVLETVTAIWARNGEMGGDINAAFSDGRITRAELNKINGDVYQLVSACMEMLNRLSQLVE